MLKKSNVIALCALLCAALIYVTVSRVYARQEETQRGETRRMSGSGPTLESMEQPESVEIPEVSETRKTLERSADSETAPLPLPSDTPEFPESEEDPMTDKKSANEPQEQEEINKNPAVAAEIKRTLKSLNTHIDYIAGLIGVLNDYILIAGDDNFYEALAIYAIRHDQIENYPYGVVISDKKESAEFQSIHWRLNMATAAKTENGAVVRIARLSAVGIYALSDSERDAFDMLNSTENRKLVNKLLAD
jgi:hypothetical protein